MLVKATAWLWYMKNMQKVLFKVCFGQYQNFFILLYVVELQPGDEKLCSLRYIRSYWGDLGELFLLERELGVFQKCDWRYKASITFFTVGCEER